MAEAIIAAAITTGGAALTNTLISGSVLITFGVNLALYGTAQAIQEQQARRAAKNAFSAEAHGRTVTFRSATAPRQVNYGEVMTSGPLVFAEVTGGDNQYLHLVIPIAGHRIESVEQVYFNDRPVSEWDEFHIKHRVQIQRHVFGGGRENDPPPPNSYSVTIDGTPYTETTLALLATAIENATGHTVSVGSNSMVIEAATAGPRFTVANAFGRVKVLRKGDLAYRITSHLGASDQVADPDLVSEVSNWTNSHRLRGIAYLYVRMTWMPDAWPNGVPNIKALIRGKNDVYDPRTSSSGWTDNWALCVRDYINWSQGLDVSAGALPNANWIAAANACDEIVRVRPSVAITGSQQIPVIGTQITAPNHRLRSGDRVQISGHTSIPSINGIHTVTGIVGSNVFWIATAITGTGSGGTVQHEQSRYTCNGQFTLDKEPIEILEELRSASAGALVWQQGEWLAFPGVARAPSFSLDQRDLRGAIRYRPKSSQAELFNAVKGLFVDPHDHYEPTDFKPVINAFYEGQDGRRIFHDIDLPYTNDEYAAQRIARVGLEVARQSIVVVFPAKISALGKQIGVMDVGLVSIDLLGWTDKQFQVLDWSFSPDGGVDLVLQEYAPEAFDWNTGYPTVRDYAPDTNLPNPFVVLPPENLVLDSGTDQLIVGADGTIISRIFVAWENADAFASEFIVEYKRTGDVAWFEGARTRDTQAWIFPVIDGRQYDVQVIAVNHILRRSPPTLIAGHTVVGKTEPPPDVTTFLVQRQPDGTREFSWTMNDEPADLAGYKVRVRLGTGFVWDNLEPMHEGLLTASPWETNQLARGTYTVGIKAVDTSGNESENAVLVISTLGDPRLKNAIEDLDPRRQGWPGNLTECWVEPETGNLVPLAQYTWASAPATWDEWTSWNWNLAAQMVYEYPVIDLGINTQFTPFISATANGTVTIEVRVSDDNMAWSSYAPAGPVLSGQYVQCRVTVDNPDDSGLTQMRIVLDADRIDEILNDVDTSTLGGSVGLRRIPITKTYQIIRHVNVALQSVTGQWTVSVVDKDVNLGPLVRLEGPGGLADAVIDIEIIGL